MTEARVVVAVVQRNGGATAAGLPVWPRLMAGPSTTRGRTMLSYSRTALYDGTGGRGLYSKIVAQRGSDGFEVGELLPYLGS